MRRALRKFFDRKAAPNATAAAGRAPNRSRAGPRTNRPPEDGAAGGRPAELDAHRRQRDHAPQDEA
jgi:hypothetical protein